MKQIGYIFKFSEIEDKGILVYGHWNDGDTNFKIKDRPIKFFKNNCMSEIKTGQLVYFEFTNNGVANIERASLSNFKIDVLHSLITWKKGNLSNWYEYNTHIIYQRVFVKSDYKSKNINLITEDSVELFMDKYFEKLLDQREDTPHNLVSYEEYDLSIDDWYDLFWDGCDEESEPLNRGVSVNILDIDLWVDNDILQKEHFGTTVEEILQLCDIFIYKQRTNENNKLTIPQRDNNYISGIWKNIISSLNFDDLQKVFAKAPILQPLLPDKFCMENLSNLTDEFGMPSIKICIAYNLYNIRKSTSASEYDKLTKKLFTYSNCGAKHLDGEGIPMCKMGQKKIMELTFLLENRFEKIISNNIKKKFKDITGIDFNYIFIDSDNEKEIILSLGRYFDKHKDLSLYIYSMLDSFEQLPKDLQDILFPITRKKFNRTLLKETKNTFIAPSNLKSILTSYEKWIDHKTLESIFKLVNPIYSKLDNIDELRNAYDINFITSKQFFERFKILSIDYKVLDISLYLANTSYHEKSLPLNIQWYLISKFIKLFDFKSLNTFRYKELYYDSICDIRSLLIWLNRQVKEHNINSIILKKAENLILCSLTNKEKWILFEESLVSTPDISNIRDRLACAYRNHNLNATYFEQECFQEIMLIDAIKTSDKILKFLIADHLNYIHLRELEDKSDGVVKLFIWLKNPSEDFDWDLITSHMSELPDERQFELFKYIFYLIAVKKINYNANELYQIFVNERRPICSSLRGVLYLLKEKISSPNISIKSNLFEEILGKKHNLIEHRKYRLRSYRIIKQLFYECNGHIALTFIKKDYKHQSFNGFIEIIQMGDERFYAITFFKKPHNIFDEEIESIGEDTINDAKFVLIQNIKTKIVNDKYIINVSYELELKQYIMAYNIVDRCCLLDTNSLPNQKHYLYPNSCYLPLYTNQLRPYDYDSYSICRDFNYNSIDPINGIPFYWCNRKPCARQCHYILPVYRWDIYKFSDLLFILYGRKRTCLSKIWNITSELSNFLDILFSNRTYPQFESIPKNRIKKSSEIGVFGNKQSIIQDIKGTTVRDSM